MLCSTDLFGVVSYVPSTWHVAGLGIRYFCTVFAVRCSAPFRKPELIALSNEDIGGLHKLWCMNLTSFSLLVRCYKKDACSVVSLLTILVGVVLHRNIVFGIIVRGNIVWGLLDDNIVLDDSIVFGIIVHGIIVHVNIVWGLFGGNISASCNTTVSSTIASVFFLRGAEISFWTVSVTRNTF